MVQFLVLPEFMWNTVANSEFVLEALSVSELVTYFSAALPLGLTDPMLNLGGSGGAKGQIEAVNLRLLCDSYQVSSCVVCLP